MPLGSGPGGARHGENPARRFLAMLGPGLITGAADDDPSGIGTYTAAGASLGLATLWTAALTLPLMAVVQYVCAKIGMVSGMGLAGVLRKNYSRGLLYPAIFGLLIANTMQSQQRGELAEQLQKALDARVVIEQAKGVLMAREGLAARDAYERMRADARRERRRLRDVAEEVIARNRAGS